VHFSAPSTGSPSKLPPIETNSHSPFTHSSGTSNGPLTKTEANPRPLGLPPIETAKQSAESPKKKHNHRKKLDGEPTADDDGHKKRKKKSKDGEE